MSHGASADSSTVAADVRRLHLSSVEEPEARIGGSGWNMRPGDSLRFGPGFSVRASSRRLLQEKDFLRSGEKDIHAFAESRRGRKRRLPTSELNATAAEAIPDTGIQP